MLIERGDCLGACCHFAPHSQDQNQDCCEGLENFVYFGWECQPGNLECDD